MKKIVIVISFIFFLKFGFTQNLVPNHSFETLSSCPTDQGQLNYAVPWFSPTYSSTLPMSDVFNTCVPFFPYGDCGVPNNDWGFQYPRTGSGYAGECVFADTEKVREYISVQLNSPLVAGKTYCIGYYVSLCNYSFDTINFPNRGSRYAIDCMGAYLSNSAINLNTYYIIPVTPQIENPYGRFLYDTLNWMLVSGTYYSSLGGEQYITIGNFYANDSTNNIKISNSHSHMAYYYIDDVYVMDCADTTHNGINEIKNSINISVYPSPTKNNITIEAPKNATIEITNIHGQLLETLATTGNKTNIDVSALAKGMYFVKVKTEKGVAVKKFIKE